MQDAEVKWEATRPFPTVLTSFGVSREVFLGPLRQAYVHTERTFVCFMLPSIKASTMFSLL